MTTSIDNKRLMIEEDDLKKFNSTSKRPKHMEKSKILQQNILSDFKHTKRWSFIPLSIFGRDQFVSVHFKIENEKNLRSRFFESLKDSHEFFQNTKGALLPDLVNLTTMIESSDNEVVMSVHKDQFRSMQILLYTRYMISFTKENVDTENREFHMSQYPCLLKMYNGRDDVLETQKMTCFVKIIREWVIFNIKQSLNDSVFVKNGVNRFKEEVDDYQLNLAHNLHAIVDVAFRYFDGDVDTFSAFFKPESIGLIMVFHFLFMNSINKIHFNLVEELNDFFKIFDEGKERLIDHGLRARHLSLVINANLLQKATLDENGYFDINRACAVQNIDPIAFKLQIYSLLCDPYMDTATSLSMLCYMTSPMMNELQNKRMRGYASMFQTPYKVKSALIDFKAISYDIFKETTLPFDAQDIKRISETITISKKQKEASSSIFLKKKKSLRIKKKNTNPLAYFAMIKKTSTEHNILSSPSTRIDSIYLPALLNFLRELEKHTIMNYNHLPQFFSYDEYADPTLQIPLRLTSNGSCIYLNDIFLSKY